MKSETKVDGFEERPFNLVYVCTNLQTLNEKSILKMQKEKKKKKVVYKACKILQGRSRTK